MDNFLFELYDCNRGGGGEGGESSHESVAGYILNKLCAKFENCCYLCLAKLVHKVAFYFDYLGHK